LDGCADCARYVSIIEDQARALAEFADEVPPWAPSVACIYWLYGPTRWGSRSWNAECNQLKPLIRDIGDLPAAKLTPLAWAHHVARRKLEAGRRGEPPADHLLNLELGRAKQLLSWGVSNGMLKHNPLLLAKRVKAVCRRETWLPLPDIERLLAACDDVVDGRRDPADDDGTRSKVLRSFTLACHDSMLRLGEALGVILHPERIGAEGRVELASRNTKGNKRRTVFLTPRTVEAIQALPHGVRINRPRIERWFRQLCEVAGVDSLAAPGERRIRPHDLRASGASTADENGARATAIRDTMGHAQISTTSIYLRSGQAENAKSTMVVMSELPGIFRRPAVRAPRPQNNGNAKNKKSFLDSKLPR
jgi:integrase